SLLPAPGRVECNPAINTEAGSAPTLMVEPVTAAFEGCCFIICPRLNERRGNVADGDDICVGSEAVIALIPQHVSLLALSGRSVRGSKRSTSCQIQSSRTRNPHCRFAFT